jgi:hypothetical protein
MRRSAKLSVLILFLLGLAGVSCSQGLLGQASTGVKPSLGAGEPSLPTAPPSRATVTPSPAITVIALPSQVSSPESGSATARACANSAEFVKDVTIPDGEIVTPGAPFTKTWRLINSGTCTWDDSYALVLVDGDLDGAPKTFPLSKTVAPGEGLDLSIPIIAPLAPGDHHASWLLRDGGGNTFGVGPQHEWPIWVRVIVQGDQAPIDGRATPYSDSPAAGICGEAEGDLATMTLLPGIPDPRCLTVRANQRLRVINRTEGTVEISLAGVTQTLEPDGSFTFTAAFGELLQPGVHALAVDPCCGGEIWLKQ